VAWCPFPLFGPLGLVISYVVINTGLLFISLFVALCVKLDPDTHEGNEFSFSLKTGCDSSPTMPGARSSNLPLKINEASPTRATNLSSTSRLQPSNKGKAPMVEYGASSSEEESRPIMTQLRVDAPGFISLPVHNSGDGQERCELRWQGVCPFPDNTKGGHASPQAMISNWMSSEVMAPQSLAQGLVSQKRRQWRQRNACHLWKNFPAAISDPIMIKPERDFIIETIMSQDEENCSFLKDVAWKNHQISVEQMICRDSRSIIPWTSTSSDIIGEEFMGRIEALTEWLECQESSKKESRHG
jgi:hypothetical protein